MKKRSYLAPVLLATGGGSPTVDGHGSGQGSNIPQMSYEEWWADIAWEGENPDCDYDGNGEVNRADYDYYIENELWNG